MCGGGGGEITSEYGGLAIRYGGLTVSIEE